MMLKAYKDNRLIVEEVENANNFFSRFMGLMYRKSMARNHGLLLTPCNEIHTFGMKFDIDTVTMDKGNVILLIDEAVPPNKVRKKVKNGYKVLELNSGVAAELGLEIGDTIEFK